MKMKKFDQDMEAVKRLVKENLKDVERILGDAPPENCFWVNNGPIIKNIQELPSALEQISEETFLYHVNKEKNDFARWIEEVVQDKELARSIEKVKRKQSIINRVKGRIEYLQSIREKFANEKSKKT